jgi:signal-transduction protein with cAMP-binding, CBS, and nucleotidyltransferase domain
MNRTAVFRRRVRDAMGPPPLVEAPTTAAAELVRRLAEAGASAVVLAEPGGPPVGIVTEQDVVRRVAFRSEPAAPAAAFMSAPVETVVEDDLLYHAIARMRRAGRRHMPAVDGDGRAVGMLSLDAALADANGRLLAQIDRLTHDRTLAGMAQARAAQAEVAAELLADGAGGPEVQAWLSDFNNDLHARIARLLLGEAAPPVPFALLVMGSGGRGESGLAPDQDNGLVLADYPDERHDEIDAWFRDFSGRLTEALAAVGLPLCRGNVMATNPVWRKSLGQWMAQLDGWIARRREAALRSADIFFDFRCVFGEAALARALRAHVAARARGATAFLSDMARQEEDYDVALGLFDRFVREREDPAHRGEVNLKLGALTPMVDAVRLYALREGVEETSTTRRIALLERAGTFGRDEADALAAGYAEVAGALLARQVADVRDGRQASNFVAPDALTARERRHLVEALKAIRRLHLRVRADFTGRIL